MMTINDRAPGNWAFVAVNANVVAYLPAAPKISIIFFVIRTIVWSFGPDPAAL